MALQEKKAFFGFSKFCLQTEILGASAAPVIERGSQRGARLEACFFQVYETQIHICKLLYICKISKQYHFELTIF